MNLLRKIFEGDRVVVEKKAISIHIGDHSERWVRSATHDICTYAVYLMEIQFQA